MSLAYEAARLELENSNDAELIAYLSRDEQRGLLEDTGVAVQYLIENKRRVVILALLKKGLLTQNRSFLFGDAINRLDTEMVAELAKTLDANTFPEDAFFSKITKILDSFVESHVISDERDAMGVIVNALYFQSGGFLPPVKAKSRSQIWRREGKGYETVLDFCMYMGFSDAVAKFLDPSGRYALNPSDYMDWSSIRALLPARRRMFEEAYARGFSSVIDASVRRNEIGNEFFDALVTCATELEDAASLKKLVVASGKLTVVNQSGEYSEKSGSTRSALYFRAKPIYLAAKLGDGEMFKQMCMRLNPFDMKTVMYSIGNYLSELGASQGMSFVRRAFNLEAFDSMSSKIAIFAGFVQGRRIVENCDFHELDQITPYYLKDELFDVVAYSSGPLALRNLSPLKHLIDRNDAPAARMLERVLSKATGRELIRTGIELLELYLRKDPNSPLAYAILRVAGRIYEGDSEMFQIFEMLRRTILPSDNVYLFESLFSLPNFLGRVPSIERQFADALEAGAVHIAGRLLNDARIFAHVPALPNTRSADEYAEKYMLGMYQYFFSMSTDPSEKELTTVAYVDKQGVERETKLFKPRLLDKYTLVRMAVYQVYENEITNKELATEEQRRLCLRKLRRLASIALRARYKEAMLNVKDVAEQKTLTGDALEKHKEKAAADNQKLFIELKRCVSHIVFDVQDVHAPGDLCYELEEDI